MLKFLSFPTTLFLLCSTLALVGSGCSNNKQVNAIRNNEPPANIAPTPSFPAASTPASVQPQPAPATNQVSVIERALDKAASANSISQSALSPEDWNLAVTQWQGAIALLKQVPKNNPNFALAQSKIAEFQRQINNAKQQATRPAQPELEPTTPIVVVPAPSRSAPRPKTGPPTTPVSVPVAPAPAAAVNVPVNQNKVVFQAPIKRRASGTPIIDVTFNDGQAFEMIVDTGASGTVITQQMAQVLGVEPVAKAKANTASAKGIEFLLGYVDSMQVGDLAVRNVRVAIAGPELDTGLLGHDFFGDYDITIKRDVVEFHPR